MSVKVAMVGDPVIFTANGGNAGTEYLATNTPQTYWLAAPQLQGHKVLAVWYTLYDNTTNFDNLHQVFTTYDSDQGIGLTVQSEHQEIDRRVRIALYAAYEVADAPLPAEFVTRRVEVGTECMSGNRLQFFVETGNDSDAPMVSLGDNNSFDEVQALYARVKLGGHQGRKGVHVTVVLVGQRQGVAIAVNIGQKGLLPTGAVIPLV